MVQGWSMSSFSNAQPADKSNWQSATPACRFNDISVNHHICPVKIKSYTYNKMYWLGYCLQKLTFLQVEEGSDVLTGLVLRDLLKNITTLYKFANYSYELGEDNSLLIPSSAKVDCGIYRCTLWPPLGHYIQEGNSEYRSAGEDLC